MHLWVILVLNLFLISTAQARTCKNLFVQLTPYQIQRPASQIYASQGVVGKTYALVKGLTDAGLDPHLKLEDLSKKQLKKLHKALLEELSDGLPGIIAPNGRVFIVDGHHDLYLLSQLPNVDKDISITIHVLKDYSKLPLTFEEFKIDVADHQWFYGKSIDQILDHPLKVSQLKDSFERSQTGLAFLAISQEFKVPFKGKNFYPFVQFLLADVLRDNQIFFFSTNTSNKEITQLAQTILNSRTALEFLVQQLRPNASAKLRSFLQEKLAELPKNSL